MAGQEFYRTDVEHAPPPYPGQQHGQFAPQPMPYTQQPQTGYWAPPQQQYGSPTESGPVSIPVSTVIVQQPEPAPAGIEGALIGAYVASCLTFWCCNPLFGAIGFFIALGASSAMSSRNYPQGRRLAYAAISVSVAGIIISVILVAVIISVCAQANA